MAGDPNPEAAVRSAALALHEAIQAAISAGYTVVRSARLDDLPSIIISETSCVAHVAPEDISDSAEPAPSEDDK